MDDPLSVIRMKYAEDIEEILQCPICFEKPTGAIPVCENGHHCCHNCQPGLVHCPSCQGKFQGSRNYLAESLSSKFEEIKSSLLDPKHSSNKRIDRASIPTQTDPLMFHKRVNVPVLRCEPINVNNNMAKKDSSAKEKKKYPCLIQSCAEVMVFDDIVEHFQSTHKDNFLEVDADSDGYIFFNHCWTLKTNESKRLDYAISVNNKGIFYLKIEINDENILNGDILMINDSYLPLKFYYFMNIEGDRGIASKAYDGTVQVCPPIDSKNTETEAKSMLQYNLPEANGSVSCTLKLYH